MRLSEIKGEQALDVIAEMIDPIAEIMADKAVKMLAQSKDRKKIAKVLLKDHKKSILAILALLDGEDPENYAPSLVEIPNKLLDLLHDPDIAQLFFTPQQTVELTQSSSATENIEAGEK